jgi:protein TonB
LRHSLIYSIILHILIVFLALFFTAEKGEKGVSPFFAHIITPEELKSMPIPPKLPPPKKEELSKMPKIPRNIPLPKEKSSIPSQTDLGLGSENKADSKIHTQSQSDESEGKEDKTSKSHEKGIIKEGADNIDKNKSNQNFKEKFFDKDVIGQLAKRYKDEPDRKDSSITFDTKEFKYYGYLQRLKEKIESIWRYPPEAAEKGIYGDLYIRFTIKKNGRLGAVELLRTSGHKSLDDAAIKALKDAEPYWPLPDEWGKDGFTITGHFIYSIYGTYIR